MATRAAVTLALLLSPTVCAIKLSRAQLLRRLAPAAAVTVLAPRVPPAAAGEPARPVGPGETFYQSDDKSFDFVAPSGWTVAEAGFGKDGDDPRRFFPEHIFKVTGKDGKSSVEVTVDLGYGTGLGDLGKPEAAAQRLLSLLPGPPAKVSSVEKVSGVVRGSAYLLVRTDDGRVLKAAVLQKKVFAMAGSGPGADAVVETFQAWPTNIFCQTASNKGAPRPGHWHAALRACAALPSHVQKTPVSSTGGPIVTGTCY